MSKSLVQKALADMLSALGQKALADRLSAWAPEPEEPQGSQHLVEVVTCPWEPAGKPVAEVVELATVAPAWSVVAIIASTSAWRATATAANRCDEGKVTFARAAAQNAATSKPGCRSCTPIVTSRAAATAGAASSARAIAWAGNDICQAAPPAALKSAAFSALGCCSLFSVQFCGCDHIGLGGCLDGLPFAAGVNAAFPTQLPFWCARK